MPTEIRLLSEQNKALIEKANRLSEQERALKEVQRLRRNGKPVPPLLQRLAFGGEDV